MNMSLACRRILSGTALVLALVSSITDSAHAASQQKKSSHGRSYLVSAALSSTASGCFTSEETLPLIGTLLIQGRKISLKFTSLPALSGRLRNDRGDVRLFGSQLAGSAVQKFDVNLDVNGTSIAEAIRSGELNGSFEMKSLVAAQEDCSEDGQLIIMPAVRAH